ncbi:TPA: conjugal transfer protein TraD [Legionella pneumophila]|uniref:conjugal transfer protein TraD n=1 Tax=Legionella pneumophila TaxID=446 RepID=UPI001A357456|nr:conjugal transfer protein TraD [Legionella pneumophila]HAT9397996.1 conjugal transfer protein TraD [Legionella pneumophila subsp. pneumophila]MCW8401101.1 conjugal transfer protein TraD [Legionella pneumophila]MCZ4698240.1 conjugal transfer protein TraD [Legionella pneumophila]MCZ4713644.1 conjugal transfer protein TraD [Legionella pneumophila]MCZ4744062.1 conjugal transfer protein TraD [Legionella pneumophila]
MTILKKIEKERQFLNCCEKSLALEKLKKRKADTRHKIELGGLVIKSRMAQYNKATILGALDFVFNLIKKDHSYQILFESMGENIFSN